MLFVWLVKLVEAHLLSLQNPLQGFSVVLIKPEQEFCMPLAYWVCKEEKEIVVIPLFLLRGIVVGFSFFGLFLWFAPNMNFLNIYLLKLVWFNSPLTISSAECKFSRVFPLWELEYCQHPVFCCRRDQTSCSSPLILSDDERIRVVLSPTIAFSQCGDNFCWLRNLQFLYKPLKIKPFESKKSILLGSPGLSESSGVFLAKHFFLWCWLQVIVCMGGFAVKLEICWDRRMFFGLKAS